jgi:mannosyltransferase OCH1-like enzyme
MMFSWRLKLALLTAVLTIATYQVLKPTIKLSYDLFLLPLRWPEASAPSLITEQRDKFDVTFERYPVKQDKPGNRKTLHIPPIIHHINLGGEPLRAEWNTSRKACLDVHKKWKNYLWEDDNASEFVADNFPEMKSMWDNYRYPVQRVDALRYMLLYKLGGKLKKKN